MTPDGGFIVIVATPGQSMIDRVLSSRSVPHYRDIDMGIFMASAAVVPVVRHRRVSTFCKLQPNRAVRRYLCRAGFGMIPLVVLAIKTRVAGVLIVSFFRDGL